MMIMMKDSDIVVHVTSFRLTLTDAVHEPTFVLEVYGTV